MDIHEILKHLPHRYPFLLVDRVVEALRALQVTVATGRFGADMAVALVNDGPVTFWLQV